MNKRKYSLITIIVLLLIFFQNILLFLFAYIGTMLYPIKIINYTITNNNESIIEYEYQDLNLTIERLRLSYNLYSIIKNLDIKYEIKCKNITLLQDKNIVKIWTAIINKNELGLDIKLNNIVLKLINYYSIEILSTNMKYENNIIKGSITNEPIILKTNNHDIIYKNTSLTINNCQYQIDFANNQNTYFVLNIVSENNKTLSINYQYAIDEYILDINSNILNNNINMQNKISNINNIISINSNFEGQILLQKNLFEYIPSIFHNTTFGITGKSSIEISNNQFNKLEITGKIYNGMITSLYKYGLENKNINLDMNINKETISLIGTCEKKKKILNLKYTLYDNSKIISNQKDILYHELQISSSNHINFFSNNIIFTKLDLIMYFNCFNNDIEIFYADLNLDKSNFNIPIININNINQKCNILFNAKEHSLINHSSITLNLDIRKDNLNNDKVSLNFKNNKFFLSIENLSYDLTKNFYLYYYNEKSYYKNISYISIHGESLNGKKIQLIKAIAPDSENKFNIDTNYFNKESDNKIFLNIKTLITKNNIFENVEIQFNHMGLYLSFLHNNVQNFFNKNNDKIIGNIHNINQIINDLIFTYNYSTNENLIVHMIKENDIYTGNVKILNINLNPNKDIISFKNLASNIIFKFIKNISLSAKINYKNNHIWIDQGIIKSNFIYIYNIMLDLDTKLFKIHFISKIQLNWIYNMLPYSIMKHCSYNYSKTI